MENYEKEKYTGQKDLKELNDHLPDWIKKIVALYTSDLKYEIKKRLYGD